MYLFYLDVHLDNFRLVNSGNVKILESNDFQIFDSKNVKRQILFISYRNLELYKVHEGKQQLYVGNQPSYSVFLRGIITTYLC